MPSSGTISQIQLPDGNIYDLGSNLTLGETSETAYRGDRGKIAYDHSQTTHAPANAEANQNAFSNITVGSTIIAADSKTDTFTLTAGSNVTLTPDAANDKITIAATDTTYSSKSAASGGTDVSLVTTGEKYTWNNKGTYSKPSDGIPKTDLASAVQTSLGKADTALQNKNQYVNLHPENAPVLLPFMHNDIAFLTKRGGSVEVKYDNVVQTVDISNAFDGSGSYWGINPTGTTTIQITLTLHKTFAWGNTIYIDFGASNWIAKSVKIEVINSNFASDVWTQKYSTINLGEGHASVSLHHTPVGGTSAGDGFNKIRFTLSDWKTATIFRVSQIGVYNYASLGLREPYMSRGLDDDVMRSITPFANNTYSLGSSSKKWSHIYATDFNGYTIAKSVPSNAIFTDTTYSSKPATSGGTDVSLVTTGEKYTWNNKSSFSGNYNDLSNKPTIPTVNNATLTIQKNGSSIGTFTANASSDVTANIIVPTTLADLSADETHRLVTDTEKALWNSKTKITINRWESDD